jgi:hypothetical protein
MWVRLLSGCYAGQERDVRADQAKVMLADGRAELLVYAGADLSIKAPVAEVQMVARSTRQNRGRRNG